jgi:two-component system OmpR family response regulator
MLVVEDDDRVAGLLVRALGETGYAVDHAPDGATAGWMVRATEYDGIVLDVGLPDTSGTELCASWRREAVSAPVLMLTARTTTRDKVAGLDAGADDYLAKPFDMDEFLARVRALVRRGPATHHPTLVVGDLELDPAMRRVTVAGDAVELSAKEFAILETLMRRPGQVVSRFDLLEHVWDGASEHSSNVITVYIRNLRTKLDRPGSASHIETVRGAGYRLTAG